MTWLKLTSKALYLMDSGNEYLEKFNLSLTRSSPAQYKMDVPLEWFQSTSSPGQLIVALETSSEPQRVSTRPTTSPPKDRNYIQVSQSGKRDSNGLEILDVALMSGTTRIDRVQAVAGAPGKQAFRLPADSQAGSAEPPPEGYWDLGEPGTDGKKRSTAPNLLVEFASGISRNFSINWPDPPNDGLGPVFVSMYCQVPTARRFIGFHLDNNFSFAPGTVGCIGIVKDPGLKSLRQFVSWFDDKNLAPHIAVVDWGLGSI